jgi:hypothetical protein
MKLLLCKDVCTKGCRKEFRVRSWSRRPYLIDKGVEVIAVNLEGDDLRSSRLGLSVQT